jgi:transposase
MGREPDRRHECEWREKYDALCAEHATLASDVQALKHQLAVLQRRLFGPRSEKMPRVDDELRAGKPPDRQKAQRRRAERAEARKKKVEHVTTPHQVPALKRRCPSCGGEHLKPLGGGKESVVYEFVPAHFIAHRHVRETLACPCGEYVVTAEGPTKWVEKSHYAPSFVAHLVTAKCADSIPLYRLEKELGRIGIPVARSTMTDLFHRAADTVQPLVARLERLVREAGVVHGDETPKKVLAPGHCKTGYVWVFRTQQPKPLILYRFAMSRSGQTPEEVLGGTKGRLVVDAYTGYNSVTDVEGRSRVGCHAHLRRYFFDALSTAPDEARKGMDFILGLYRIERDAEALGVLGTSEHLAMRKKIGAPIRKAMRTWLRDQRPLHPPKSPIGAAIRYALNQWKPLGRFLEDASIPLDNNPAESALRRVALGRRNFLFVGNKAAGEHLAGLYSLVATCEANGVNPVEYLGDVLERINDHPNSRLDELLPHNWCGPPAPSAGAQAC